MVISYWGSVSHQFWWLSPSQHIDMREISRRGDFKCRKNCHPSSGLMSRVRSSRIFSLRASLQPSICAHARHSGILLTSGVSGWFSPTFPLCGMKSKVWGNVAYSMYHLLICKDFYWHIASHIEALIKNKTYNIKRGIYIYIFRGNLILNECKSI